jgi:hypothetical protein
MQSKSDMRCLCRVSLLTLGNRVMLYGCRIVDALTFWMNCDSGRWPFRSTTPYHESIFSRSGLNILLLDFAARNCNFDQGF